jgi:beta-glucosidase
MRAIDPRARIGIPLNLVPTRTDDPDPPDAMRDALRRIDGLQNRLFLGALLEGAYPDDVVADIAPFGGLPVQAGDGHAIAQPLDWLGVNYYFDRTVEASEGEGTLGHLFPGVSGVREAAPPPNTTDMGWPITPHGLHELLVGLRDTYSDVPPLWVSENGAAFDDPIRDGVIDDARRIEYLEGHVDAVRQAIDDGVDVRAYFVWSLLDNFEWAEGYAKRFGLVHVDFATQRRTPRRSASWFRDVIAASRRAMPRGQVLSSSERSPLDSTLASDIAAASPSGHSSRG